MRHFSIGVLTSLCAACACIAMAIQMQEATIDTKRPDRLEVLAHRVQCFYALHAAKNYGVAYEMLAESFRGSASDKKEWIAECEKSGRHARYIAWSITSVRSNGNLCRVEMRIRGKVRRWMFFGWREIEESVVDFWKWENDGWFIVPPGSTEASHWTEDGAVEVKPPAVEPGCPG